MLRSKTFYFLIQFFVLVQILSLEAWMYRLISETNIYHTPISILKQVLARLGFN